MKKTILLSLVILLSSTLYSSAQKLEENKTDEFTKNVVKRTSWETLVSTFSINTHFRFSNINGSQTLDLKVMMDKVFAIDKDQELMFKLDNDDVVKLQNMEFTVTCKGCGAVGFRGSGAEGIEVYYPIGKDDIEKLKTHKVTKVRLYTKDGYIEGDVKEKNADKIMASLNLI